jgi:hypothetical protein
MPEDQTRVAYDEHGGKVTVIPSGTPKEEMAKMEADPEKYEADNKKAAKEKANVDKFNPDQPADANIDDTNTEDDDKKTYRATAKTTLKHKGKK